MRRAVTHSGAALLLLNLALAGLAEGQSAPTDPAANANNRGVADVAFQGYYLGGNSTGISALTGTAISFHDFYPGLGLINSNLEGYDQNTQGKLGDNFVQLKGVLWQDRRWVFTGGDFRLSASAVTFPFQSPWSDQPPIRR
jgi:hypothetical protein